MPNKPPSFNAKGQAQSKRDAQRQYDRHRGLVSERGPYQTRWWRETRRRIAIRDGYQCQQCGCDVGKRAADYVCDHKEPRVVGSPVDTDGQDGDANLWTLCVRCDASKRGRGG